MNAEELNVVLADHALWLADEGGKRANLRGADLYGANLRGANLRGADLSRANLYGADLRDADLRGADLSRANLSDSNLCGANLSRANLSDSNLCGANLSGANLSGADLSRANLRYAFGNMIEVKSLQIETWRVVYTKDTMAIGCQQYPLDAWFAFNSAEISEMDSRALTWWLKWRGMLQQIIEASPAE